MKVRVERHIATGRLRAVRTCEGASWRIREDDLAAFVATWETNEPAYRPLRAVSGRASWRPWQGEPGSGKAWQARLGAAGHGAAWRGWARQGPARHG